MIGRRDMLLMLAGAAGCSGTRAPSREGGAADFERVLLENITSFWYPRSVDREKGGYELHFGRDGEALEPGAKMIVTQARMVWFFSRMAREGHERPGVFSRADLQEAAGHGYRFLRDKMWDADHGGFYWQLDATGNEIQKSKKDLYGQAFGLYGLSEYYLATRDEEALELAVRLFGVLEEKAHDAEHQGYLEFFHEDWTRPEEDERTYMDRRGADGKLMNTHLHLLEAMTAFYQASELPRARERLLELIGIETDQVVREDLVACTDKYRRDWTPLLGGRLARVSYGHDLENIWLVGDACETAGVDPKQHLPLFRELFAYARRYGFDEDNGGLFYWGEFERKAENKDKEWWVQAEALVSSLYMLRLTGETGYREVFERCWQYVWEKQIDWKNGEWHRTVTDFGWAEGNKGDIWKCAYHNGRAMIECMRRLLEMKGGR